MSLSLFCQNKLTWLFPEENLFGFENKTIKKLRVLYALKWGYLWVQILALLPQMLLALLPYALLRFVHTTLELCCSAYILTTFMQLPCSRIATSVQDCAMRQCNTIAVLYEQIFMHIYNHEGGKICIWGLFFHLGKSLKKTLQQINLSKVYEIYLRT